MRRPLQLAPSVPLAESDWLKSNQARVSIALCVLVLLLGIYTAVTTARIVIQTYSPVIFGDQWSIVDGLMHNGGHIDMGRLWAQHNEHRIPVGRLACSADLLFFGGRNESLLIEIYLVQFFLLLVFAGMVWRYSSLGYVARYTALGLVTFCVFHPIQVENFVWGFEITFVMAGFAAALAFACIILYSEIAEQGRSSLSLLIFAIFAALISEGSLANGILVWPILLFLAFALKLPTGARLLIAAAGILAIAAYLKGYKSPSGSHPLDSIQHPLDIANYVITYLASTWDPYLPSIGSVSEDLTILAVAATLFGAYREFLKRASANRFEIFLYANMLFVIMSAGITALGRMSLGIQYASASRYQSISLIFWVCFGLLLLSRCARSLSWPVSLIQIQVAILVLMISGASRFASYEKFALDRQAAQARGYAALATNPADKESLRLLYPAPQLLPDWYNYLRAQNWGPDPAKYH